MPQGVRERHLILERVGTVVSAGMLAVAGVAQGAGPSQAARPARILPTTGVNLKP